MIFDQKQQQTHEASKILKKIKQFFLFAWGKCQLWKKKCAKCIVGKLGNGVLVQVLAEHRGLEGGGRVGKVGLTFTPSK